MRDRESGERDTQTQNDNIIDPGFGYLKLSIFIIKINK